MLVLQSQSIDHYRILVPPFCFIVCLLVWVFRQTREFFSLILRRHHNWYRTAHFDLHSTLMSTEQWGFFNVPHLLWNGPILYNGHFRSRTRIAERLTMKLSLPVLMTWACPDRGSNPDLPHARRTHYHDVIAAVASFLDYIPIYSRNILSNSY